MQQAPPQPYPSANAPTSNDTLYTGGAGLQSIGGGTNMSFNPYNKQLFPSQTMLAQEQAHNGNNDTKMSNNEAFMAFLQKNDDDSDE